MKFVAFVKMIILGLFLEASKGDTRKGDREKRPESQAKGKIQGILSGIVREFQGVFRVF